MLENTFVLGIHFRGKEMNTTPGHPFAPTVRQMTTWTDRILENHPVEKIFFSSEEKDYLDLFVKRYGKRLLFLPFFRVSKVNAYNLNPRPLHRHLLGKEALLDSLMLSCRDILLCGKSGITSNAVRSSRRLKLVYTIHNGYNSRNLLAAKFLYRLKKHLPPGAGGLRNEVVISRYPEMEDTLYEPGLIPPPPGTRGRALRRECVFRKPGRTAGNPLRVPEHSKGIDSEGNAPDLPGNFQNAAMVFGLVDHPPDHGAAAERMIPCSRNGSEPPRGSDRCRRRPAHHRPAGIRVPGEPAETAPCGRIRRQGTHRAGTSSERFGYDVSSF